MKQSCDVLIKNKQLLVFPILNFGFLLIVLFFSFSFFFLQNTGHSYLSENHWKALANQVGIVDENVEQTVEPIVEVSETKIMPEKNNANMNNEKDENTITNSKAHIEYTFKPIFNFVLIFVYLISMILITFFNTAFFNEIIHALNGQSVSITGGIKFALSKWKTIILWALLAASVGLIIRKIGENFGFIGRFVVSLIGMAWSVATVFAIPVIIREEQSSNPIKVLKTSSRLIKEKWGEGLIGYIGTEAFGFLFFSSFSIVCCALAIVAFFMELNGFYFVGIGAFWLFILTSVFNLQSIINNIFQCALYLYATEGVLPLGFDENQIKDVWKVRNVIKK